MDESRRANLLGVKLKALVAEHLAVDLDVETAPLPNGAALLHETAAWVLIDGNADRSLGAALAWAIRRSATELHLVAEAGGGTVARRATALTMPISVWFAQDRTLLPVVPEPLVPTTCRPDEPHRVGAHDRGCRRRAVCRARCAGRRGARARSVPRCRPADDGVLCRPDRW